MCFTAGIMAQPANSEINKGNEAYRKGDYKTAIESYKNALRKDPANNTARFNLANALQRQNELNEANKNYDEVVKDASLNSLKDGLEMEKGWVELRKRTSMTLAAAVGYTGNTVKTFYTNGLTATNPNQVAYWMHLYQYGSNKLDAMANVFYGDQQGFVSRSVQNGNLSFVDQDGVLNAYSTPANQIITTFIVSPQSFNFVNGQLISTGVVTQPGTTLPGQISVPNAGVGTQPQLPGTSVGPTMPGSIDPTLVAPRLAPGRGVGQQTQVATPTLVPSTALPGATATTNTNGVQYIMVPVGRQ